MQVARQQAPQSLQDTGLEHKVIYKITKIIEYVGEKYKVKKGVY